MRSAWLQNRQAVGLLILLPLAGACAKRTESGSLPQPPLESCAVLEGSGALAGNMVVAVTDAVNPAMAPGARNRAERTLFAQLYETLVHVSCAGEARPGLAESWSASEGGRRWTFVLRRDAQFWDGTSVSADDVRESWVSGEDRATRRLAALGAGPDSVVAASEMSLVVGFDRVHEKLPFGFAHPDLSIVRRAEDSSWPIGTGPYRIAGSATDARDRTSTWLISREGNSAVGPAQIELRARPGADPRDLLDEGVDFLITDEPSAVDYALARGYLSEPLPWDRTYVLLTLTSDTSSAAFERGLMLRPDELPGEMREELASSAVRREARGAEGPYWWAEPVCRATREEQRAPGSGSADTNPPLRQRVVYPAGDPIARDLAERIAAVTGAGGSRGETARLFFGNNSDLTARPTAVGLPPKEMIAALRTASELAYVISLPRHVLDPCAESMNLLAGSGDLGVLYHNIVRLALPLVDARSHVIARPEIPLVLRDWDGTPLFASYGQLEKR